MIDKDSHEKLRAQFNPEGSELRKMQLRMLDMLKYIDKVCRENNIKYWLSYGTCLGAVRHGGFIPWDDDVDIEIEKKDYKKLISILKKNSSDYVVQDGKTDLEYTHNYPKLRDSKSIIDESGSYDKHNKYQGIFIDIFLLEPSNSETIFKICGSLWYRTVLHCINIKNKWLRICALNCLRFLLNKILFPVIRVFYKIKSHGILRNALGGMFPEPRYITDIEDTIRVSFEGVMLPIPKGYDHYLTTIYGDYMRVPPLSDIETHVRSVKIW